MFIFHICTFQWLKCTNLKDELKCSHNCGEGLYLLQSELSTSTRQYTKSKKNVKRLYIQKNRHFAIMKTICITFYIQKSWQFALRDFSWRSWNWHLYTKSMTLCVMWRFYKQKKALRKNQDNLRYFFIYKKADTLRNAIFHEIFEIGGGGGIFICKKQCTLRYIFICKKTMHFLLRFIYNIYCILLIPNYKRMYDQSYQIDK